MFAILLHGGWDTLVAAALFWLCPFIIAFLISGGWYGSEAAVERLPKDNCRNQALA